jgi:hypothetical protein
MRNNCPKCNGTKIIKVPKPIKNRWNDPEPEDPSKCMVYEIELSCPKCCPERILK